MNRENSIPVDDGTILFDQWLGGEVPEYLHDYRNVPIHGYVYTYEDYPPGRATIKWYATREAAVAAVDDEDARMALSGNLAQGDVTYSDQTPEGSSGSLGFGVLSMLELLRGEGRYWTRELWPEIAPSEEQRILASLPTGCALCGKPFRGNDWIDSPSMGGLVHSSCYAAKAQENFEANGGKALAERLLVP